MSPLTALLCKAVIGNRKQSRKSLDELLVMCIILGLRCSATTLTSDFLFDVWSLNQVTIVGCIGQDSTEVGGLGCVPSCLSILFAF